MPMEASERAGFTMSGKRRMPLVSKVSFSKTAKFGVTTSWNSSSCLVSTLSWASSRPAVLEPVYFTRPISISAATLTSIR